MLTQKQGRAENLPWREVSHESKVKHHSAPLLRQALALSSSWMAARHLYYIASIIALLLQPFAERAAALAQDQGPGRAVYALAMDLFGNTAKHHSASLMHQALAQTSSWMQPSAHDSLPL